MNNHAYIVGKKIKDIPAISEETLERYKKDVEQFKPKDKLKEQMLKDLQLYGGCKVCLNCDIDKYPCNGYCELGGCCGGGTGKIKKDMWEYRGAIDYQSADTNEVEKILKDYDSQHSELMDKLAKE
jgi:hypothetical protein